MRRFALTLLSMVQLLLLPGAAPAQPFAKMFPVHSDSIWRHSANDKGDAERVTPVAGVPDMKFESRDEEFDIFGT